MKICTLISCILLISCGSSKKTVAPTVESRALEELVASKKFILEATWASPMATNSMNAIANSGLLGVGNSGGSINLIGNSNFLKIEGDTITAHLPYYGERQMGGGYSSEIGIKFKGIPKKYKLTKEDTTQRYTLSFQIREATEVYTVNIALFPNWTSTIIVNSSQRTSISYQGEIAKIPEKE